MRYWRLFFVLFLLTFTITGCHRRRERVLPPPQAQAPIISTLPPLPPLTLQTVQLAKPNPAPPPQQPAPAKPKQTHPERIRHHRVTHKPEPDITTTESRPSPAANSASTTPAEASSSSSALVGKLSADDSTAAPDQTVQTQHLIEYTEGLLKQVSPQQQAAHKDTIAQVGSFLAQARQALNMNDQVGAQTLANKAKILVDELLK